MTTSISSLSHAKLFRKYNFVVSQLKYLTPRTTSLGISKMWSTNFLPSKWTEIRGILSRFQFIKINKTVQMFNISFSFKEDIITQIKFWKAYKIFNLFLMHLMSFIKYRKLKTIFMSSLNFPCLLGHPVPIKPVPGQEFLNIHHLLFES